MTTPMTLEGAQRLRDELEELKSGRRAASVAIGEARKLGDLKENADYHAAKERQGMMEARIRYIESRLADAQIIDIQKIPSTGRVIFGSTVTLENLDTEDTVTYRIVGEDESNVRELKISVASPLARAMIGKKETDSFTVGEGETAKEYLILKVEHLV